MKRIIGLLGVFALLLVGCGKESHEEVAKEFVKVVSQSDFDKAVTLLSTVGKKRFEKDIHRCEKVAKEDIYKLSYNFSVIMGAGADYKSSKEEQVYYDALEKETEDIYTKVQNTPQEQVKEIKEKLYEKLITKYGSKNKIPYQEHKNIELALFETLVEPYQPRIDKMYEQIVTFNHIPDERIQYPQLVKKLMGVFGITFEGRKFTRYSPMADGMLNHVLKDVKLVDRTCMQERTGMLGITEIKVIEVEEKGKDKALVRLELTDGKKEPVKVAVQLETFNDVWKVTEYYKERK